jgi:adhesin/invasin
MLNGTHNDSWVGMSRFTRKSSVVCALTQLCALLGAAVTTAGCDKAQLLAPTSSTITVSASTQVVPSGGSTEISAFVVEQSGTPVHNGTTVRFSTTLGRVEPVEVQTRNGIALTTFLAGNASGVAEVRAISGGATGGNARTNVVQLTVGAAAVNTITLRANPGNVGPGGGPVELIALVVGEDGQALPGVAVTFSADQGTLDASVVNTNASGEARTTLNTSAQTIVSATAGTKTSSNVTITVRAGPIVSITCAPTSGTGNCAAVQATGTGNTATVLFTVTRASGSSTLRTATIDFGDGTSQSIGNLAGGSATITHTYSGPDGSTARSYTATVQATDINGVSESASTVVIITPRVTTPINVNVAATAGTATDDGQRWEFTATATGGGEGGTGNAAIQSYTWDFGDDSSDVTTSGNVTAHIYETESSAQTYTVTVTVRTADGRTATGRTEILVAAEP